MAQPATVDDTVIYTPRNLYCDKNVVVTVLDGSQIEIWGPFFVNGSPLATIGSLPIATQAEAVAGTDNSKVMTPLRTKESIVANAPGGAGAVASVNGETGVVVLNQDEVLDGATYKQYSQTEKTKLSGIFPGATVNSTDATLLARANHTGTQSADTIVDGSTNHVFTTADDTKLTGIAAGATQNSPDATLLARANHTGSQAISTVTNLQTTLDGKATLATGGTFAADILVPDEVYGSAWNGSLEVPTKNAVYDKIETVVGGGGGLTQEQAEDAVAAMFAAGTHTNVTVTYNDTTPSLSLAASGGGGGLPPDGTYSDIQVTGTGTLWDLVANCVTSTNIANGSVANAKMSNVAQYTVKGRVSSGTGVVADLTPADVRTVVSSDSGGGTANFLRADGTWAAPTVSLTRTINSYSGTTLTGVTGDAGAYLRCTGSNPTYTIPPNSSVAFPIGTQIDGVGTATAMTLVAGGGVTINKARTLVTVAADSGWTALKVATDEWDVHGDFV